MREENRNLLLAILLSVVVLIGWQYFYGTPQMEQQRRAAQPPAATTEAQTPIPVPGMPTPSEAGGPAAPIPGTKPAVPAVPGAPLPREAALQAAPRIAIDTPSLSGSISLRGARIDDVKLKGFRETVDPRSPNIVLFSPVGSTNPYYAEFGWVGAPQGMLPTADTVWTADGQVLTATQPVTLTWDSGQGLVFRREIRVDERYMFQVRDFVENRGAQALTLHPYALVARHGKPATLGYYVLHEGMIGVLGDKGLQEFTYDNVAKEPALAGQATRGRVWSGVTGGFVGITDKYWAAALVPDQAQPFQGSFTMRGDGAAQVYQSNVLGDARTLAPGATLEYGKMLFAGAKEVSAVDAYQERYNILRFDLIIDWGWFYFLTKPLFKVLDFFYRLFGNFGLSILFVTVLIKIVFFPLANKSYASMAKMKAVQPEMMAIRDRYADDKMKQQQALMELYKKEKINPIAGCWPVLIQIPVFFALYKVLFVSIEMRHAPFFGWIRDLAAPDPTSIFNLFGLLPFAVPEFLHIGVWPIAMGITMWLQMQMNPQPTDPIQKTVFAWMPLIFTFMLASFPAGLVIYWAWNNLLSIGQQYFIMRRHGVKVELWDNLRGMFPKRAPAKG